MSGQAGNDGNRADAAPRLWRFGSVQLDERALALTVDGKPVKLERKPLEALLYLLRNAGRVIRKDELLAAVWPGRILSDSALTSCIAKLREALGDDDQRILCTVHGYGYRLDIEVSSELLNPPTEPPAAPVPERDALPPKPSHPGRRQLVAIMFTDVVGYTALVQRDETAALSLLQQQRQFVRRTIPRYEGREVEVIGDAFLIEFASALQAVECAIALQQGLAAQPVSADGERVALRIGLHIGDIVRPGKGVFGDSVNIAARLQAMAPEGGLAVSGPVFEQVYNKTALTFEDRGAQLLKGVERPMQVHVAEAAALLAVATAAPPRAPPIKPFRQWLLASAALLLLVVTTAALWPQGAGAPAAITDAAPAVVDRSVAVLPFANLSAAAEDRYFADGVQDSVLSKLASISGLKVISRTSVMQYRDTQTPMTEIGAALKVAHIVEGSVQRAGNRIRVTAQLIKVADDSHLWTESYERDLADVFAIQSDIAQRVASAVHLVLSANQQAVLNKPASRSPEAYNLYVQAAQIEDTTDNTPEILSRIEALLHQAIALDPQFALAHAELANTHMNWYRDGADASPGRLQKAREAMERALALDPNLSEAHTQLGFYHSEGLRDFKTAERAFRRAIELNPNAAETYEFLGLMMEDQGQWEAAIAALQRAGELNPRHRWIPANLSRSYVATRRFALAVTEAGKAVALAPDDPVARLHKAMVQFRTDGNLAALKAEFDALPKTFLDHPTIRRARLLLAHGEGRDAEAVSIWQDCDCPWIGVYPASRKPKELELAAALALVGGREAEAKAAYLKAKTLIEADLRARPDQPLTFQFLALAQAGLGQREEAMQTIATALEKTPAAEALVRNAIRESQARILIQFGEHARALELLAELARPPSPFYVHEWELQPWLRQVRQSPAFQQIVRDYRASAR